MFVFVSLYRYWTVKKMFFRCTCLSQPVVDLYMHMRNMGSRPLVAYTVQASGRLGNSEK